jgi:protein TonB
MLDGMNRDFLPLEKAEEDFPRQRTKGSFMKKEISLAVAISLSVHLAAALALVTVPSPPILMSKGAGYFEIAFFLSDYPAPGGAALPERKSAGASEAKPGRAEKVRELSKEREIPAAQETVTVTIAPSSASLQADRGTGPAKVSSSGGGSGTAGPSAREGSSGPPGTTVAMPRYFDNRRPVYPAAARRNGYEGTIILTVQVLSSGGVGDLRVKKSSGYDILDQSAQEAVRHWRFEPGRRMGQPTTTWVEIPIRFMLEAQGHF